MKKLQAQITIRLVAAMLVAMAVIVLSAITMHAPTQKPNSLTRSLKNIQTDNATLFYADQRMDRGWCVEMFFFFQAEDGIRDYKVTGVQTCALPICVVTLDLLVAVAPKQQMRHESFPGRFLGHLRVGRPAQQFVERMFGGFARLIGSDRKSVV